MDKNGIILKCVAGVYDVFIDGDVYPSHAAGKFRNQNITPLVGDYVTLKFAEKTGEDNLITEILPRKNALLRPPVANVDTLIITLAVKKPNPDLMLADYLICYCRMLGIEPIICINKSDYDIELANILAQQFIKSDIKAFVISTLNNEGIENLKNSIKEGITCFSGQSAVGKSSLTNLLIGNSLFQVGGLSKKTERGKHTTRHCQLVNFSEKKWLVDTPGFSLLEMPQLSPETLKDLYLEFNNFASECRFNGCNHINEPNCAVKNAVEEGLLSKERYERYKQIYNEVNLKWRKRYD